MTVGQGCFNPGRQQGAVSLLMGLVLLSAITVIALLTAKTVAVEIQTAANQVRTAQAVAAAQYAMEYGISYFDGGGFDHDGDGRVDAVSVPDLLSHFDGKSVPAKVVFNNAAGTRCVPADSEAGLKQGLLEATGYSDDGLASRTVSQCIKALPLLRGDLPAFALVARGSVRLAGNSRIINRYTVNTVRAGGKVAFTGSQTKTFINAMGSAEAAISEEEKINPDSSLKTQFVSGAGLGLGLDVWEQDSGLAYKAGEAFFRQFFSLPKTVIKQLAVSNNQVFDTRETLDISDNSGGLIWLEGTHTLSKGTIGSLKHPVVLVVNGDLFLSGTAVFYGLLYTSGRLHITDGNPRITGIAIIENSADSIGGATANFALDGEGSLSLVYWPGFSGDNSPALPGTAAVVPGSWRDW